MDMTMPGVHMPWLVFDTNYTHHLSVVDIKQYQKMSQSKIRLSEAVTESPTASNEISTLSRLHIVTRCA